jgi:hypothetical protein
MLYDFESLGADGNASVGVRLAIACDYGEACKLFEAGYSEISVSRTRALARSARLLLAKQSATE